MGRGKRSRFVDPVQAWHRTCEGAPVVLVESEMEGRVTYCADPAPGRAGRQLGFVRRAPSFKDICPPDIGAAAQPGRVPE